MEERTVADSRSVLVHWMGPTETNTAYLTMVAVDEEGRPASVPALQA